ncbi:MAG TPA: hypothetical protein VIU43_01845, partial [Nitrosospira sp.]
HFTTFKPSMHIVPKVDIAVTVKNANSCKTGYRAKGPGQGFAIDNLCFRFGAGSHNSPSLPRLLASHGQSGSLKFPHKTATSPVVIKQLTFHPRSISDL